MSVFFTSDLHIGHRFVAGTRNFFDEDNVNEKDEAAPDTEAHDEWVADLWDSAVKKGDTVFILGDVSVNGKQEVLDWIGARPGIKHLIAGNHDPVHPANVRSLTHQKHWLEYFATIQPFLRRKLLGHSLLLSHFPYFGEGGRPGGDRYTQYRLRDEGLPLLHGHTHGPERQVGHMLHVGLDAWMDLVPQDNVIEFVKEHYENA